MSSANRKSEDRDKSLREHLLYLLRDGGAHIDFQSVVSDFPLDKINDKAPHVPYTAWQVLEHMRIAQWDILEFSRNAKHVSPRWPEGYWPDENKNATPDDWHGSIENFTNDLKKMEALIEDPNTDLFQSIPHGDGQTILREAMLVADHNAYHLGVLVVLKRLLKG
ncbi:MAG TPA: DinB family protein [Blastocatellia bacterium]|nr:DinB family protein [Blastocatellia bacterium]